MSKHYLKANIIIEWSETGKWLPVWDWLSAGRMFLLHKKSYDLMDSFVSHTGYLTISKFSVLCLQQLTWFFLGSIGHPSTLNLEEPKIRHVEVFRYVGTPWLQLWIFHWFLSFLLSWDQQDRGIITAIVNCPVHIQGWHTCELFFCTRA